MPWDACAALVFRGLSGRIGCVSFSWVAGFFFRQLSDACCFWRCSWSAFSARVGMELLGLCASLLLAVFWTSRPSFAPFSAVFVHSTLLSEPWWMPSSRAFGWRLHHGPTFDNLTKLGGGWCRLMRLPRMSEVLGHCSSLLGPHVSETLLPALEALSGCAEDIVWWVKTARQTLIVYVCASASLSQPVDLPGLCSGLSLSDFHARSLGSAPGLMPSFVSPVLNSIAGRASDPDSFARKWQDVGSK